MNPYQASAVKTMPTIDAMEYRSQWQERIGWKLFTGNHFDSPDIPGMKDCVHVHTVCMLSFIDRLKLLVSGKLQVISKTATENVVGKCMTVSGCSVRPPAWLERKD